MTNRSHPYANLPSKAFWKTAVADRDAQDIELAWQPKAPIARDSKIITAGSCFAQHIGRSLKENGFAWVDSEPAPADLPVAEHARNGYGVFSFRTGNIYTAALLKQWMWWATGKSEQSTEFFLDDGRYYDPFRPSLHEEGFSSVDEMLAARRATLAAILESIKQANLFVLTLGLTEAWLNKIGMVYPMCPGAIRGTFCADQHKFHNYSEREIERDVVETFDELRRINPDLRFLLTVSPVPLTATASGQHVLTATTYSKSVLRSAAGYLAQSRDDVDYFPAYELITAPAFKGRFYDSNLRSVSPDGVAFVMSRFLRALGTIKEPEIRDNSNSARANASNSTDRDGPNNDICDDVILESWNKQTMDDAEEPPNILLIGDSQMGMVAKAFDEQGIRYAGGGIMNGSDWHALQFVFQEAEPFFLPTLPEAKARWNEAYAKTIFRIPRSERGNLWILTNVGCQTNQIFSMNGLFGYLQRIYGGKMGPGATLTVSMEDLRSYIHFARPHHIRLLQKFADAGFRVIWIGDPPTNAPNLYYLTKIEQILAEQIKAMGCEIYSASSWVMDRFGALPKVFASTEIDPSTQQLDIVHGSPEYYRQLVKEVFSRFSITPHTVN